MLTFGFVPPYGDVVTEGVAFSSTGLACVALYLNVTSSGNIVWLNAQGKPQYAASVPVGQIILGATQIVASATVNGVSRTTTATVSSWAGVQLNNTP